MKRILALVLSLSLLMADVAPVAMALNEEATAETPAVESVLIDTTEGDENDPVVVVPDTAEKPQEETPQTETLPEETPAEEPVTEDVQAEPAEEVEYKTEESKPYEEVDMEIRYTLNGVEEIYSIKEGGTVKVIPGADFDIFAYDNLTQTYVPITHVVKILEEGITATCYGELRANLKVAETAEPCSIEFIFHAAGRQYYLPIDVVNFQPHWATYYVEETGENGDLTQKGVVFGGSTIRFGMSDYWGYTIPVGDIVITSGQDIVTDTWISDEQAYVYVPNHITEGSFEGYIVAGGIKHYFSFGVDVSSLNGIPMGNGLYWCVKSGTLHIYSDGTGSGIMDTPSGHADWYNDRDYIYRIKLHPGVKTVDNNAFSDLKYVDSVDLGTVEEIWAGAFGGMRNLTEITLPETLKKLGRANFSGTGITTIRIPAAVETIEPGAFDEMSQLKSINIDPANTTYKTDGTSVYGKYKWGDGYELIAIRPVEDLYLPDEITEIHGHVISSAETVKNVYTSDANAKLKSVDGVLYSRDGKKLLWYPAARTEKVYEVVEGTEVLDGWSFSQTGFQKTGLEELVLPTSITGLGMSAFSNNETLKTIRYKGSQAMWDKYVEVYDENYSITIYDKYEVVFEGTDISGEFGNLEYVIMGDLIEISGTGEMTSFAGVNQYPWFEYRDQIKRVRINEGVTSIGDGAFSNYGITELTLPDSMKTIGKSAFQGYYAKELVIPGNVESIGAWAFVCANNLETGEIYIPAATTYIGEAAFGDGTSVKRFTVNGRNPVYHSDNTGALYEWSEQDDSYILHTYPSGISGEVVLDSHLASIIGPYAFLGSQIQKLTLEETVEIRPYAFLGHKNLTEITFGREVLNVMEFAFQDAFGLKQINYPYSEEEWNEFVTVERNGNDYFLNANIRYNCNMVGGYLTDTVYWEYDQGRKWLFIKGEGAMPDYTSGEAKPWDEYKDEIRQIYIQDEVSYVGAYAFEDMPKVWHARINSAVTGIGAYAFKGLKLDEFSVPRHLTTIPAYAFAEMDVIKLWIPVEVTWMYNNAFADSSVDFVIYEGNITQWFSIRRNNNDAVLMGGDTALLYENSTTVTGKLSDNIEWAFDINYNKLTLAGWGNTPDYSAASPAPFAHLRGSIYTVEVGRSISGLGNYLFHELYNLSMLSLTGDISKIGNNVFDNCADLWQLKYGGSREDWNKIDIGDNNTYIDIDGIGEVIFDYSTFENGEIGEGVFWSYDHTTDHLMISTDIAWESPWWEIPEMEEYPWTKFRDSAKSLYLDGAIECVPARAFQGFWQLTTVGAGPGVHGIGDYAFADCDALKEVNISLSKWSELETIDDEAFLNCRSLTEVVLPANIKSIGDSAFSDCVSLQSIELPENLTSIGQVAFINTPSLKNIKIPAKVTKLPAGVFRGSGIEWISVPTSVKTIDNGAFEGCGNLSVVYYGGTEKQWKSVKVGKYNESLTYAALVCGAVSEGYSAIAVKNQFGETLGDTVYVDLMPYTTQWFDLAVTAVGMDVSSTNTYIKSVTGNALEIFENGDGKFGVEVHSAGETKIVFGCYEDDSLTKTVTFKVTKVAEAAEITLKGMTKAENGNYKTTVGTKLTPVITWIGGDAWNNYEISVPEEYSDILGFDAKGNIVATGAGYGEIILVCGEEGSDMMVTSVSVEVYAEKVKGIEASATKVVLDPSIGHTGKEIWFWPTNDACGEFVFTWTENPAIRVEQLGGSGVYVEALSSEKASITITAKALDGSGKTFKVTVQTGVAVNDIHFTGELNQTLAVGKSMKVALTVAPADATNKTLKWSVVDAETGEPTDAATVNNGTIKAVRPGRVTVMARTTDGTDCGWGFDLEITNPAKKVVIGDGIKAITIATHLTSEPIRLPVTVLGADGTTTDVVQEVKVTAKGALVEYGACDFDYDTNELVLYPSVGKGTVTITTKDGTNLKATLNVTYEVHMLVDEYESGFEIEAPKGIPQSWDGENDREEWTVKEGATIKPVAKYNWGEKLYAMPKALQKFEMEVIGEEGGIVVDNAKGSLKAVKPGKYEVIFKYTGGCEECPQPNDVVVTIDVTPKAAANLKNPAIVIPRTVWSIEGEMGKLAKDSQVQLSATFNGQKASGATIEWKAYDILDLENGVLGDELPTVISKTGKLNLKGCEAGDMFVVFMTATDKKYPDNFAETGIIVEVTEKAVAANINLINVETGEAITAAAHKPSTEKEWFVLDGIDGTAGIYEVTSASPKVATVETVYNEETGEVQYVVKYVGTGTANITVTAKDGSNVKQTLKVKVEKHAVPVSAITMPVKAVTVNNGQPFAINFTVKGNAKTGEEPSNPTILWTLDKNGEFISRPEYSENPMEVITTGTEGQIVIRAWGGTGKVTLTGKAMDGSGKTFKLTINTVDWESGKAIERMSISYPANTANDGMPGAAVLTWGKSLGLKLNMVPPKADAKSVVWEVFCWNEEIGDWDADMAAAAGITVKAGKVTVPKASAKITPYTGEIKVVAKLPYMVYTWVEDEGDVLTDLATEAIINVKAPIEKLTIAGAPKTALAGEVVELTANKVFGKFAEEIAEYPLLWSVNDKKLGFIESDGENAYLIVSEDAAKGKTVKVTVQTMDGTGKKATVSIKIG